MRECHPVLKNIATVWFGMTVMVGCRSAGHNGVACSDQTEPQPMLTTAAHSTAPAPQPDSGIHPMVPANPKTPTVVMSHAEDYTWLEGVLEYIHSDSGHWKLRYAPLSEEDPFGGSVVLDSDVRLEKFQDGDIAHVEGELVRSRSSVYVSSPLYRIHSIQLISHGN